MRGLGDKPLRRKEGRPPLIYGHRGVRGAAPENTLKAFEIAKEQGADGIELDVRLDRDGEIVVLHDPTFERVTGGKDTRAAAELPYEEIRRIDVGDGERAPRLSEILAFARKNQLRLNVEMKRDVPNRMALVRAVSSLLQTFDPKTPLVVSSFDPAMIAAFGALSPRIPRALLVHRTSYSPVALSLSRSLGQAVHVERTLLKHAAAIEKLTQRGLIVNVWTVNDPSEAKDLHLLGVDGIITDVPERIRNAIE